MPGFEAVFAIAGKFKEGNLADYFAGDSLTKVGRSSIYKSRF